MRAPIPELDLAGAEPTEASPASGVAYRLSVSAGTRHTPLLRLAHRLRAAALREGCAVVDHHFEWCNGAPVLIMDLQLPDPLLSTRNRLYGCAEQLLDEAMFSLPWDAVPLISEGNSGKRSGNGLVVRMECLLQPLAQPLSAIALDALERAADTKQLALALATRVLRVQPQGDALDALLHSRFSSIELDLLGRRAASVAAAVDLPESSAMYSLWTDAPALDFLTAAMNRLGFTARETAYLLLLADHAARASHKEIAA